MVRRDANKPFYTATVKLDNPLEFERVKRDFRYFFFEGKPCRALPYLQANFEEANVEVRNVDREMSSRDLENYFSRFGEVISCKVNIDEKHKSLGSGFVCFASPDYA